MSELSMNPIQGKQLDGAGFILDDSILLQDIYDENGAIESEPEIEDVDSGDNESDNP